MEVFVVRNHTYLGDRSGRSCPYGRYWPLFVPLWPILAPIRAFMADIGPYSCLYGRYCPLFVPLKADIAPICAPMADSSGTVAIRDGDVGCRRVLMNGGFVRFRAPRRRGRRRRRIWRHL